MSNSKGVRCKPRLLVLVNLVTVWPPARVRRRRYRRRLRPRRSVYVPKTNIACSHDNYEKINTWVFFSFRFKYVSLLGGPSGCRRPAINFTLNAL